MYCSRSRGNPTFSEFHLKRRKLVKAQCSYLYLELTVNGLSGDVLFQDHF